MKINNIIHKNITIIFCEITLYLYNITFKRADDKNSSEDKWPHEVLKKNFSTNYIFIILSFSYP